MTEYVRILVWTALVILTVLTLGVLFLLLYNVLRGLCMKGLEYRRYFSEDGVFEGEEFYLIEELSNHSFLPMINVDVESHITSKIELEGCEDRDDINQYFISRFTLMPFKKIRRRHKARALKRGYYELESAKVEFAGMDLYLESYADIYVYPRELELNETESMNRYVQYDVTSKIPLIVDSFSFNGIRDYTTGDSLRSVNFKATAKRGRLMADEKGYIMGRQIQIYLNFQMPERGIELESFSDMMENAMAYIAHIIGEGMRRGYKIGLSTNSRMVSGSRYLRFKMSTGMAHYRELLKELALIRVVSGNSFASIIDMDLQDEIRDSEIYVMTTYMDEAIDASIDKLKMLGNTVNVIMLREPE